MTTDASQMNKRMTAHVVGDVQGVGYRAYARRRAQMLGVRGYAKNLADGSVEVVAEGPRYLLEQLLATLRRGPMSAQVTDAQVSWSEPTGEFSMFSIR
jgi:acylphosphatase